MNKILMCCLSLGMFAVGCSKEEKTGAPQSTPPTATANQGAGASPASPAVEEKAVTQEPPAVPAPPNTAPVAASAPSISAPPAPAAPVVTETPSPASGTATKQSALETIGQLVKTAAEKAAASPAPVATPAAETRSPVSIADLPADAITRGLKEALGKGLQQAISQLGKEGGFLTNLSVRIPMPEKLQTVEKTLRKVGQDKIADEFITTMNRAAEQAVPAASAVFADSLKQMTVEDAQAILRGTNDAATQYFRRTSGTQLAEKFHPIVKEATAKTGVTAAYKQLMDKASFASPFLKKDSLDLDGYVTAKAMDGLFKMVADEEKRIRENPVARTTDLLKSVFGLKTK